ncbi:MAG: hypothetical protein U0U09_03685 [Cyclobacteriaceae bacterium]
MKDTRQYIASLALSVTLLTGYAQSQEQTTPTPRPVEATGTVSQTPKLVSDPMVSERLGRDLNTRNNATETQTIKWYETNYGYTGNYAIGSAQYMARYDQQGNYVETLRRTEWNKSTVPATLINAYGQSPYKNQTVTGYWSVTDPGKSGYYLELRDKSGAASTVWADGQGKFSTAPYSSTTATSGNIPKD